MKLNKKPSKFKSWYKKPRRGAMFRFSEWILTSKKAFDVVFTMGHIIAALLFGGLFILSLIYMGLLWKAFLGIIFLLSLRNFYKYYKLQKQGISMEMNVKEFVYKEDKNGNITKHSRK